MTAEKIKKLRQRKKTPMRVLAKYLGVAISTYRSWEMGRKIPSEAIKKIAQFHGVSVNHFLGNETDDQEALKKAVYYFEEGLELVRTTLNEERK